MIEDTLKNFKDKNIDDQADLNSMILNIKNEYEDNWKSINKMNSSTSVPIRLSLESNNTQKSLKLENALDDLDFVWCILSWCVFDIGFFSFGF